VAVAQSASRAKDDFLAMLGHELRNPLAPIAAALDLIDVRGGQMTGRERQVIGRQVDHLTRLVDDLLDVSRITRGEIQLRREPVSLRRVLDDAVESVAEALRSRGHRLSVDVPCDLPDIQGDATRLTQVFHNLLENAAKYTPQPGTIELCARLDGDELRVRGRDDGVGIAKEAQTRVFDLFTRVEPGEGLQTSGLGIGLALGRRLVEMHDGRVDLFSAGPGSGSEFTVRLPLPVSARPAVDRAVG
jgi:signal transduction histidine kinase